MENQVREFFAINRIIILSVYGQTFFVLAIALLRPPSPWSRLRHPHRPRASGPQRCEDDHDLHPRHERRAFRRPQSPGRNPRI